MTTREEFGMAVDMINSCNATIACGCKYDKYDAEYLYQRCKEYIKTYEEKSLV